MQSHALPSNDHGFDHAHAEIDNFQYLTRINVVKDDEYECKMAKSWSSQGYEGLVSQT